MGSSVEQSPVANRRSKSPESKKTKDDLNKPKKRSRSRSPERRRTRRHKRSNSRQSDDEEYPRYYGDDNKNSDRYWNKYPKKDETRVGARYYDMEKDKEKDKEEDKTVIPPRQRKIVDLLTSKTGGAYIPPAKLRLMQKEITDKTSPAYQRIAWEALKKSIQGHVNKANTSNIKIISKEIFQENIIRGRGLLCKSIIKAQSESPTFTRIYAALIAIINSKFPNIGELLLKRLVLQFKRGYKQNNKTICITAVSFIAHLVNQQVAHEILALEILTLLVHTPTDDSVEVAISFLKESGQKLTEVSSKGISAIFEMLRNILHEGKLEKRIQYMIEVMFQIRKDGFKDHAAILEDHDIVKEDDQITHLITLDSVEQQNSEDTLNVFKFDDVYEQNEKKYETIVSSILESDDSGSESGSEGDDDDDDEDAAEETGDAPMVIVDKTETTLVALRRTIYLTIQSSLDFEECAHKLLKMELKPGQEVEFCHMFLDCCAEQRTYEKFYGLLAQRFCQINKIYVTPFEQIFKDTYATSHRLDTSRLRNVSKFFAHLLFTDSIGWEVMEVIQLTEETTTSSSRIFIKILFQELSEYMGLAKLNARLNDPTLQGHFSGLFPRDNPNNSRFSINFFTSSGLGGLTDGLREHLRALSKMPALQTVEDSSSSSSSSESSSSSDSSSSSSSSSSDSSSEEESGKKSKNFRKKDSKNQKKVVDAKRGKFGEDKFKSPRNDRDRRDLESDRMPNSSRRFERSRSTDRNDRQRDYKPREDRRNERDERRYDKQSRTDERRPERDERRPERDERRPERDERRPKRDESRTKRDVRDERSSGRDERRDGRDDRRDGRDERRNGRDESRNGRDERERRRGRDERREKV